MPHGIVSSRAFAFQAEPASAVWDAASRTALVGQVRLYGNAATRPRVGSVVRIDPRTGSRTTLINLGPCGGLHLFLFDQPGLLAVLLSGGYSGNRPPILSSALRIYDLRARTPKIEIPIAGQLVGFAADRPRLKVLIFSRTSDLAGRMTLVDAGSGKTIAQQAAVPSGPAAVTEDPEHGIFYLIEGQPAIQDKPGYLASVRADTGVLVRSGESVNGCAGVYDSTRRLLVVDSPFVSDTGDLTLERLTSFDAGLRPLTPEVKMNDTLCDRREFAFAADGSLLVIDKHGFAARYSVDRVVGATLRPFARGLQNPIGVWGVTARRLLLVEDVPDPPHPTSASIQSEPTQVQFRALDSATGMPVGPSVRAAPGTTVQDVDPSGVVMIASGDRVLRVLTLS